MSGKTPSGPIFIGACSRSGTTMLGSMLGGHSKAVATPESQFKEYLWQFITDNGSLDGPAAADFVGGHLSACGAQRPGACAFQPCAGPRRPGCGADA